MFLENSAPEFTSFDYSIFSYAQVYLILLLHPCFKDPPKVFLYSSSASFTLKFLPETILLFEKTSYKLQVALRTSLWLKRTNIKYLLSIRNSEVMLLTNIKICYTHAHINETASINTECI